MTNLRLEKEKIAIGESVRVYINVSNTGTRRGDEVVQMYIRDELSTVTRPVKELKDFAMITLDPGENKTVELEITPDKLKFYDIHMDYVVEAGEFTILVGNSSADKDLQEIRLLVEADH